MGSKARASVVAVPRLLIVGPRLSQSMGPRVCGLRSCDSQALEHRPTGLLSSMWDLSGPGVDPCSLHWQVDSLVPPAENL